MLLLLCFTGWLLFLAPASRLQRPPEGASEHGLSTCLPACLLGCGLPCLPVPDWGFFHLITLLLPSV